MELWNGLGGVVGWPARSRVVSALFRCSGIVGVRRGTLGRRTVAATTGLRWVVGYR